MLRSRPFAVPRLGYRARTEDNAFNFFLHSKKSWLKWKSVEAERGRPSLTRTTQAKKIMDILHWSTHEDNLKTNHWFRLKIQQWTPPQIFTNCYTKQPHLKELFTIAPNKSSFNSSAAERESKYSQRSELCPSVASFKQVRWGLNSENVHCSPSFYFTSEMLS